MIKNIVLDIGNVLIPFSLKGGIRKSDPLPAPVRPLRALLFIVLSIGERCEFEGTDCQ